MEIFKSRRTGRIFFTSNVNEYTDIVTWEKYLPIDFQTGELDDAPEGKFVEEFFRRRFKREPRDDDSYFIEWLGRFVNGNPEGKMDSESLAVYKNLCKEDRFKNLYHGCVKIRK